MGSGKFNHTPIQANPHAVDRNTGPADYHDKPSVYKIPGAIVFLTIKTIPTVVCKTNNILCDTQSTTTPGNPQYQNVVAYDPKFDSTKPLKETLARYATKGYPYMEIFSPQSDKPSTFFDETKTAWSIGTFGGKDKKGCGKQSPRSPTWDEIRGELPAEGLMLVYWNEPINKYSTAPNQGMFTAPLSEAFRSTAVPKRMQIYTGKDVKVDSEWQGNLRALGVDGLEVKYYATHWGEIKAKL